MNRLPWYTNHVKLGLLLRPMNPGMEPAGTGGRPGTSTVPSYASKSMSTSRSRAGSRSVSASSPAVEVK